MDEERITAGGSEVKERNQRGIQDNFRVKMRGGGKREKAGEEREKRK